MDLPEQGTRWTNLAGSTFVVSNVSRQRVLLLDEETGEPSVVQNYRWPVDLVPIRSPQEESSSGTIRAALVGGAGGIHFQRIYDLAADQDIELVYHYPGDISSSPKVLPSEIQLVVFLTSHLGHKIYGVMKIMSKQAGIPIVHVTSQGFEAGLRSELEKIGVRKTAFGAADTGKESGIYYEWTGVTYEAREVESQYVRDRYDDSIFLSLLLALASIAVLL